MVCVVVGDDGGGVILLAAGVEVWFEIGIILIGGEGGRAEVGIERRGVGGGGEEGEGLAWGCGCFWGVEKDWECVEVSG